MSYKIIIGLFFVCATLNSCDDGCLKCSGPTADQQICEGDFNEKSDFENYVKEYEEEGGICE